MNNQNIDKRTVESFGHEWTAFDQAGLPETESLEIFNRYFSVFPWESLPANAAGFDMGCGSGRWAKWVCQRVGNLHCIDPSSALDVAKKNLSDFNNVNFYHAGVGDACLPMHSQDFGYSLGVLHHVPDTQRAVKACVDLLKPGAPFLLYLYYSFENRSKLFRAIWKLSDFFRQAISKLPGAYKNHICDFLAIFIYYPLSRLSYLIEKLGFDVANIPLSAYRNKSFYTMRTDSRDRFGTPLEQRFSKNEIETMMTNAGLGQIVFSESEPYWCVVGRKK